MQVFIPGYDDTIVSADGNMRVRVEYDPDPIFPLEDWEYGCSVYPVDLPRNVREDYYTAEGDGPLDELWVKVLERLEYCEPAYDNFTVESRAAEDPFGAGNTTGGLLRTDEDAVQVFTRLARLQGVTVRRRILHGNSPGHWADVIAWSTECDEFPQHVFNDMQYHMQGEVYGLITEKRTRWTSEDGDTMDTWDAVESVWGIVGSGHAKAEAEAIIEYVNSRAA